MILESLVILDWASTLPLWWLKKWKLLPSHSKTNLRRIGLVMAAHNTRLKLLTKQKEEQKLFCTSLKILLNSLKKAVLRRF